MASLALHALLAILPWPVRRWLLCRLFGYRIHPTARIGLSLICPRTLTMEAHSYIGHLTVVRGIESLSLGLSARLGNLNWVSGVPAQAGRHFHQELNRSPQLVLEEHSAVTHRHHIDCTDAVRIGRFTTVAGWGTQILTHAIDLQENRQSCAPVSIGPYCFVGTRSVILKGVSIADRCVLAAGAVASNSLPTPLRIYGGVPAKDVGSLSEEAKYLHRGVGRVD